MGTGKGAGQQNYERKRKEEDDEYRKNIERGERKRVEKRGGGGD